MQDLYKSFVEVLSLSSCFFILCFSLSVSSWQEGSSEKEGLKEKNFKTQKVLRQEYKSWVPMEIKFWNNASINVKNECFQGFFFVLFIECFQGFFVFFLLLTIRTNLDILSCKKWEQLLLAPSSNLPWSKKSHDYKLNIYPHLSNFIY